MDTFLFLTADLVVALALLLGIAVVGMMPRPRPARTAPDYSEGRAVLIGIMDRMGRQGPRPTFYGKPPVR